MNDIKIKTSKNTKVGYIIQPMHIRQAAVALWHSGEKSSEEICGIYSISKSTLSNWNNQVRRHIAGIKSIRITAAQKLETVMQIRNGQLSIEQVVERFQLRSRQTVLNWMREFSLVSHNKSEKENHDKDKSLKAAKKRAEDAELRIIALELIITEAERELGVSIRKKSGLRRQKNEVAVS